MVNILKYIFVFLLGCLFMSYNPELNSHVINGSNMLKDKVIELTGKKVTPTKEQQPQKQQ